MRVFKINDKIKNILAILIFSIFMFTIITFIALLIIDSIYYYKWIDKLLIITLIIFMLTGIFQLITNKMRFKFIKGRVWGSLFIVTGLLLGPIIGLNFINKLSMIVGDYNLEDIKEVKKSLYEPESEDTIKEITQTYQFKKSHGSLNEYKKITDENITYYYSDDSSIENVDLVNKVIKLDGKEYNKYFNIDNVNKIDIVLVDELFEGTSMAAYFSYIDKLVVMNSNELEKLKVIYEKKGYILSNTLEGNILHEYIHLLQKRSLDNHSVKWENIPKWFLEGTATYLVNNYENRETSDSMSYIGDIRNNKNFRGENSSDYYYRAACIIKYIFNKKGDTVIIDILDDMAYGNDFYKSLENVSGETFTQIEDKVFIK